MSDPPDSSGEFQRRYEQEESALGRLEDATTIKPKEKERIRLLRRVQKTGLEAVLRKRPIEQSKQEARDLVGEFVRFGAKAVLTSPPQRAGDFLNNQLRGRWAEQVVLSMHIPPLELRPFGPSGAAMPGEEDHREIMLTFREIVLLEGKRPDLLAFHRDAWVGLDEQTQGAVIEWPTRRLEIADQAIVRQGRCGVEVKNSLWHYARRRGAGGGPLSITVKEEECEVFNDWSGRTELPIVFVQVMFDEIYCMSFRRMRKAIQDGHLYHNGDYNREKDRKTKKDTHSFRLVGDTHLCGEVVFPAESTADIRVLSDGSVVPHIDYQPAAAAGVRPEVVIRELEFVP